VKTLCLVARITPRIGKDREAGVDFDIAERAPETAGLVFSG